MKYLLRIKKHNAKQLLRNIIAIIFISILPGISFGQVPSPPGGNGSLPDTPLSVPFDDHLTILLFAAGSALAIVIFKKIKKDHTAKAIQ
jgi:hypothetical protein